jgi:hypothetical protein
MYQDFGVLNCFKSVLLFCGGGGQISIRVVFWKRQIKGYTRYKIKRQADLFLVVLEERQFKNTIYFETRVATPRPNHSKTGAKLIHTSALALSLGSKVEISLQFL